jgi:hypothetical protein
VRRTHSIDDRLENARKESISKNYVTRNIWPTALRCPLVETASGSGGAELHDSYYVKAMVPICKSTYRQCYNPRDLVSEKVQFKLINQEYLRDPVIFGVLTAKNFVGQMPPVSVCEQNHEGGAAWYEDYQKRKSSCQGEPADDGQSSCPSLHQNYQFVYSFEDVLLQKNAGDGTPEFATKHI